MSTRHCVTLSYLPDVLVQSFTFSMEDESDFPGPEYSYGEDLTGSFVVPLSYTYTPFSIEIPNNYSNVSHPSSLHHQHRPTPRITSEDEQVFPSVCDDDFNTHGLSCPLCCDPSSSGLSQCPPVCYPEGLLPQSGLYQFQSHTTASHTWTPGGAVQYHTSSVSARVKPWLLQYYFSSVKENFIDMSINYNIVNHIRHSLLTLFTHNRKNLIY